jgi:hypothetical protein
MVFARVDRLCLSIEKRHPSEPIRNNGTEAKRLHGGGMETQVHRVWAMANAFRSRRRGPGTRRRIALTGKIEGLSPGSILAQPVRKHLGQGYGRRTKARDQNRLIRTLPLPKPFKGIAKRRLRTTLNGMQTKIEAHHLAPMRGKPRPEGPRVRQFIGAIKSGDVIAFGKALFDVLEKGVASEAFRAVARLDEVPATIRHAFPSYWIEDGNSIRMEVDDDGVLTAAMRKLLPPYRGPGMVLFRGDSASNHSQGSHGLSWSSDEDVARSFAEGRWRVVDGGSVLLRCVASPEAIIWTPSDDNGESEYVVDRRRVTRVEVLERFSQTSQDKYRRMLSEPLENPEASAA